MGLSLAPLKRIGEDIIHPVENVVKDVGNFGSQVAADVTNNPVAQQHATAAFKSNPVTQFVANNVVKPLAQFPIDIGQGVMNQVVDPITGAVSGPTNPEQDTGVVGDLAREVGATGQAHQVVGSGIQTALTIGSGGIDSAIEATGKAALENSVPDVVARLAPKLVSNAVQAGGFNAASAASQGETPGQIAKSGAVGVGFGASLPIVGEAVKALPKVAAKLTNTLEPAQAADQAVDEAKPDTPQVTKTIKDAGQEAAQTPQATPTVPVADDLNPPKAQIAQPSIPRVNTGFQEVDDAANKIVDRLTNPTEVSDKLESAINQSQSYGGARDAIKLKQALSKNLTKEQDEDVDAMLDGERPPHGGDATSFKVYNELQKVYEVAHGVRQAIDPSVGKVVDYSPRNLVNKAAVAARNAGSNVFSKVKALANLNDLRSGHSESRTVGKFVDSKGDVHYGSRKDLGLVKHNDGTITDSAGTHYKPVKVGKYEIEQNTGYKYQHSQAANLGQYMRETTGLKAKAEVLQAIKAEPNKYGIYTQAQIDAGEAPDDVKPIASVPDLTDENKDPMYASPNTAKTLTDRLGFTTPHTSLVGRAYDAATSAATQFIVLNPFFHGMNQLYQSAIAAGNMPGVGSGWIRLAKGVMDVNEDDITKYLDAGHSPTYGADMQNILSKATHGATKLNSKAMAAIELRLRAGLYKASLDSKMTSEEAVSNIDRFLGDSKGIDKTARRLTLFGHYFKTMGQALGNQAIHPIENIGANVNAATLAALTAAVSYGYSEFTGNPNAHVRTPGELGLLEEGADAAVHVNPQQLAEGVIHGNTNQIKGSVTGGEIAQGSVPDVVTNHLNPVGKEIGEQLSNHDLYTGQAVTASAGGRLGHLESNVIAPAQIAGKVTAGKRSIPETVANEFGLETPHAKGYVAAPKVSLLNTKGAITDTQGADKTGYQEQQNYFSSLNTLKKAVGSDIKDQAQLTDYLAKSRDPVTGAEIENSPAESIQSASMLYANNKVRSSVQAFEKSQPSHAPSWDLSPSQLKTYEQYKAMYTGGADKTNILQNNPWITKIEQADTNFYNNLPKIPGAKAPETNSQTPTYPVFNPQTTSLLAQYDNASPADRTTLLENNEEALSTAFNDIANWTNAMRKAEGAPALAGYPEASPQVQAIINTYDALPKGNGVDGGSPDRSAWITANPQAYAQMQNYLTSASVYSLIKNASEAQFAGSSANQELLKDVKNVGQYDIATTGTGSNEQYSINPAAAYSQSSVSAASPSTDYSYSSQVSADEKQDTEARDAEKAAKAAKNATPKNYTKSVKSSVKLSSIKTDKIKMPGIQKRYKIGKIKVGTGLKAKSTTPGTSGKKVTLRA